MGEDDARIEPTTLGCGIAVTIPDGDHLWRRFKDHPNWRIFDYDADRWMPVTRDPPLTFDPDFSMPWREHLETVHGLGPESVTSPTHILVFEANVRAVRQVRLVNGPFAFTVAHTPQGATPVDCAHASVYWPEGLGKAARGSLRTDLALCLFLCHGYPSSTAAPA